MDRRYRSHQLVRRRGGALVFPTIPGLDHWWTERNFRLWYRAQDPSLQERLQAVASLSPPAHLDLQPWSLATLDVVRPSPWTWVPLDGSLTRLNCDGPNTVTDLLRHLAQRDLVRQLEHVSLTRIWCSCIKLLLLAEGLSERLSEQLRSLRLTVYGRDEDTMARLAEAVARAGRRCRVTVHLLKFNKVDRDLTPAFEELVDQADEVLAVRERRARPWRRESQPVEWGRRDYRVELQRRLPEEVWKEVFAFGTGRSYCSRLFVSREWYSLLKLSVVELFLRPDFLWNRIREWKLSLWLHTRAPGHARVRSLRVTTRTRERAVRFFYEQEREHVRADFVLVVEDPGGEEAEDPEDGRLFRRWRGLFPHWQVLSVAREPRRRRKRK